MEPRLNPNTFLPTGGWYKMRVGTAERYQSE